MKSFRSTFLNPHYIPSPFLEIIHEMSRHTFVNTEVKFNTEATQEVARNISKLTGSTKDGKLFFAKLEKALSDCPSSSDWSSEPIAASAALPTPPRQSSRSMGLAQYTTADVRDQEDEIHTPELKRAREDEDPAYIGEPHPKKPKPSTETGANKTARSWIQQTWAQSAATNTTFMRLLGMNWEMVGFRHRASGTLYLTTLQPYVPGTPFYEQYGKVQIALKVAALIDWRERHTPDGNAGEIGGTGQRQVDTATQLRAAAPLHGPATFSSSPFLERRFSASPDSEKKNHSITPGRAEDMKATAQPLHTLRMWVQCRIYDSMYPALFVNTTRAAGRSAEQLANDASLLSDGASVSLRQEIIPGVAYGGTCPVFAKFAFPGDEGKTDYLLNEYTVYLALEPLLSVGIPSAFGLFDSVDEGGPRVLLLSLRRAIMSKAILGDIHRAGYVHNDLAPRNLLLSDAGIAQITDFGLSFKGSQEAMEIEMEEMERFAGGVLVAAVVRPGNGRLTGTTRVR
ncbi:hypothetical protein B0H16DRAFT_1490977 [Mycena metata]|uniref:Serine-threonine/tyrosine-protein kinase catalytic domain-containing protein n=1 Tax=Mycena metata TaxID=1033252 RepID=A0AAD7KJY4_9AGAR|nr:hypothetical protein B0H16DRAFT_1490977 [Mycena metata]